MQSCLLLTDASWLQKALLFQRSARNHLQQAESPEHPATMKIQNRRQASFHTARITPSPCWTPTGPTTRARAPRGYGLSGSARVRRAERLPATSLRFSNPGSAFCCPGPGRQAAVESAAPLSRHHPHDARGSGSGLGAASRSEFALQRQPSVRQATLEHLATPMPFSTGYFRACASGSRTANNGVHQLSLRARKIM